MSDERRDRLPYPRAKTTQQTARGIQLTTFVNSTFLQLFEGAKPGREEVNGHISEPSFSYRTPLFGIEP